MKRILPPIFMLMVVVVIAFATPIDAQKEQQQVEPITTALHTEGTFETNVAAVAALESGWGRYQFRPNNIMGFGQMEFSSMEECIDTVAAYLAKHYLSPDGKYYNGETVEGVCVRYNGNPEWAEVVQQIMEEVRS